MNHVNEFGFFLKSKIVTETFKWRSLPFRKIILIVTWSIDACESRLERGNPVGRGVPLTKGEVGNALAGAVQTEKDGFWTKLEGTW